MNSVNQDLENKGLFFTHKYFQNQYLYITEGFTDFGFKKLFGEEPNENLLLDFLNELLRE